MRSRFNCTIWFFLMIFLGFEKFVLAAEPPEYVLDEVVVTAKRVQEKEISANANIVVISRKEIERNHYKTLIDAMRNVPGTGTTQYGNGIGFEQYNAFTLNGSDKFVVLIDGIRVNTNGSPFNVFSFNTVPIEEVEKIEVLRGAASALYGADAKGGVINIVTRRITKSQTSFSSEFGSFGRELYSLRHEDKDGSYTWSAYTQKSFMGDYVDGRGRTTPSQSKQQASGFKIGQTFDSGSSLLLSYDQYTADYAYTIYNAMLDGRGVASASVEAPIEVASGVALIPAQKYMQAKSEDSRVSLTYRSKLSEQEENVLSIYRNRTDAVYDIHDTNTPWIIDVETVGISNQYTNRINKRHTLIAGADYYRDSVNNYQDSLLSYGGRDIHNTAVYLQDDWQLDDRFNITSGIRFNNNSYAGQHLSKSLTVGYKVNNNTNYYLSYRDHFVSPNQYQLFGPYRNESLSPEIGSTNEVGIHHLFNKTTGIKVSAFRRNSSNAITYDRRVEQYINLENEKAKGWDIQFTKRFTPEWQVFLTYVQTDVETKKEDGTIEKKNSIPRQEMMITLNYRKKAWDISLNGHGVFGYQGDIDLYSEQVYWVWNSAFNYEINSSAKVFFKVNNIFNKFYSEITNKMGMKWDDWYAAPGRNYQIGITCKF